MFALRRSLICRRAVARLSGQAQVKSAPKPPANTVTVNIDGRDITVHKNMTVLQACEEAGAQIPRFCYHPRLTIAGNCRMCLVEVAKSPKPVASCAMPLMPGMIIKTNTPMVKKAREGVMEFLLINHPLDCPICDQGGECDLQDLSMDYGSDRSRYREWKRTVEDKDIGPMVKTVMTRCIHCTRCVRFAEEVAGVPDLCATGRGNSVEIGTYFEKPFDSELSGNVVDLCPVGALTSKPFAFAARPWELQKTDSIDVHDALGAAIRVDTRGPQVMRILPSVNEMINEEWISDRSRNACDGLALQRLDTPMVRSPDGTLHPATWPEAFARIREKFGALDPKKDIRALVGDLTPAEGMICLKDWLNSIGCFDIDCREHGNKTDAGLRSGYLFNSTISGIEKADFILFVGTNLRMEAPVLNARIRRCQQETGLLELASIGPKFKDVYNGCEHLGDDISILTKLAEGKHPILKKLTAAKFPMVIIGQSVMRRKDLPSVQSTIALLATKIASNLMTPEWNGINVLQLHASRAGAMDLGIVSTASSDSTPKFVYLLGCDNFTEEQVPADAFVVYQGHHGDAGASRADVVLPSTAYTETSGIFVNTEGRPQMTTKATTPLGLARDDWQILRALSEVVEHGTRLPYDTIEAVRERLFEVCPHWKKMGEVQSSQTICPWLPGNPAPPLKEGKIPPAVTNFFATNVIARASLIMARAQAELKNSTNSYIEE